MTEDDMPKDQQQPSEPPRHGSMRFQDPETTTPRAPSLGEQRARRKALEEQERQEVATQEAERKADVKRKIFIGSGVTVGLVGLIATYYTAVRPDEVEAVCTNNAGVVVADQECDEDNLRSQGAVYNPTTGFWVLPLFLGGGQYRYNYGGGGSIGSPVSGGTYQRPSKANISTKSGKTVQRGGFGISGSGKSGGS